MGDMTRMPPSPTGICPNCGKRTGPVAERCPGEVCRDKGYSFIPRAWYDSAREFSRRKQRPLDPLLGRSIDRYLLVGNLGEGGMGAVYVALQRPLNREVAMKLISGLEITETAIARFEREARAISVLDHPNIVKLYDYGVGQLEFQVPYMALEYVKHGRTLRRAFAQMREESGGAPIPGEVVLSIFRQVLHALHAAHQVGIIHRDMKPDNVMLAPVAGNPYFVKVLDFGLAKALADISGFDGTVSRTGQFLGTPVYMAPEQASRKGQPLADHRADLYAVAVMLYEIFTGVRPFDGETIIEVLAKKVDPDYDPLSFPQARRLPQPLRAFLRRGMAADPRGRFQSAEEMLSALEHALSGRLATAVGLQAGRFGSSEDRPSTPASPVSENMLDSQPRTAFGRDADARAEWSTVTAGVAERRQRRVRRVWLLVMTALLVATAVAAGIWLALGKRTEPVPAQGPALQAAPLESEPAVGGARAAEPNPATEAGPAVVPAPEVAPSVEPYPAPSNRLKEVAPAPQRIPQKKPSTKSKPPVPADEGKPRRL